MCRPFPAGGYTRNEFAGQHRRYGPWKNFDHTSCLIEFPFFFRFRQRPLDFVHMYKRVEKRRRKKEEEEELGLDDDMKEVLGMQDTDSDESDSDSDSESAKESDTGIEKAAGESEANEEENADGESSDG